MRGRNLSKLCSNSRYFVSTTHCRMTFEGNSSGLQGTPEERMTTVFGGRIKGESPQSTSRILAGGSKVIAGVSVPSKPEEPDNCCMSGCVNCVWEIFNEDLREWRHKRKLAAERIKGTDGIWPAHWNPPLALLDLKNIPKVLQHEKINLDKRLLESNAKSTASLFPPRTEPLPKSVLEAKRRHALAKDKNASSTLNSNSKDDGTLDEDQEGWGDVPVYIKAFAEFERKKRLSKKMTLTKAT
ncbi:hypothetical protein HG535_0H02900 [Zygotorulaspora mrakii]|uniref:Oxidoreductase-like domain-containing protein n=1 Tax=Zygotorulaspora mrakii TaxID=42260 RepID=A0A7H9B8W0_ZYGMR|nr:uncharacterized protein HG535_0H02900 [Zygotorulaspora mrakii]QLG74963.1 hypothetical protein HG535_0H02900 [Zygotorulaspora mrakii]